MKTNANTTVLNAEEINKHRLTNKYAPAIYLSIYSKHNKGALETLWVDLSTFDCAEELYNFCQALQGDANEAGISICGYMNFPTKFYCQSYNTILMNDLYEWLEMDEREKDIVAEYWDEICEHTSIEKILDSLVHYGDFSDFAYEIAQDKISCHNSHDTFFERYFDYDKFERDLRYDYDVTTDYVFSK